MNKQLKSLEDKLIECITAEVPEEAGAVALVSVTLSAILIKINKSNGMHKEDFIELMEEAWDGITQGTH
tara:strand:- start:491 stop:697 length:207 start_codon:yes stop_codon:yes gene_type:complete